MAKGGNKGGGNSGGGGTEGGSITGNRKDNHLIGTDFDDAILGKEGNDTLDGKGGNDFLSAGEGDDDLYGRIGNDRLFGSTGEDLLDGGEGHDELFGGPDDDILNGGDGDDVLLGGLGSDYIDGGSGFDTAEFTDIGGDIPLHSVNYTVDGINLVATGVGSYVSKNEISPGVFDTDALANIWRVIGSNYNDSMTGGVGDDTFWGAQGDDVLKGEAGNDTLYGGLDNDTLEGGDGEDVFVFLRVADGFVEPSPPVAGDQNVYDDLGTGDGVDVILDFDTENDTIVFLSNEVMTVDSYTNAQNYTVLTYAGPNLSGPSEITLIGVTDSAATLILNGDIQFMVDPGFEFMV